MDPFKAQQLLPGMLEGRIGIGRRQGAEQDVEDAELLGREAQVAADHGAGSRKEARLLEPLAAEHAERVVAQLHSAIAAP